MSDLKSELASLLAAEALETAAAEAAAVEIKLQQDIAAARLRSQARKELGHGKFAEIHTVAGSFFLQRPHPAVFQRFNDTEDTSTAAVMALVQPCIYPKEQLPAFTALLEEQPAVLARAAKAVFELAGAQADEKAKK